ncbi:MAG: hypothetical protein ACJ8AI_21135 [Rhodopila sp.]|jgi:hypothetical protein
MLVMWVAIGLLVFHAFLIPAALSFSSFGTMQRPAGRQDGQPGWGRRSTKPVVYTAIETILSLVTFAIGLAGGYWRLDWMPAAALSAALVLAWLLFWFVVRPRSARASTAGRT